MLKRLFKKLKNTAVVPYTSGINSMSIEGLQAFYKTEGYTYEINDGRIIGVYKENKKKKES